MSTRPRNVLAQLSALVNDRINPGANMVYGTDADGVKGWKPDPVGGGNFVKTDGVSQGDISLESGSAFVTNFSTFAVDEVAGLQYTHFDELFTINSSFTVGPSGVEFTAGNTAQQLTLTSSGAFLNGNRITTVVDVIGLQDLFVGSAAMWPRTTSGCSDLTKTEVATSIVNYQSLDFDQTSQEFAQFQLVLPRNWNRGAITARFYWTASSGSGTVQWGISGGSYSNDDPLTIVLGTAQTVDDTLIAAGDIHVTDYTAGITLAGSPADADFLVFQISRNPANDTLSADAKLLGVMITLTTDEAVAS